MLTMANCGWVTFEFVLINRIWCCWQLLTVSAWANSGFTDWQDEQLHMSTNTLLLLLLHIIKGFRLWLGAFFFDLPRTLHTRDLCFPWWLLHHMQQMICWLIKTMGINSARLILTYANIWTSLSPKSSVTRLEKFKQASNTTFVVHDEKGRGVF